MAVKRARLAPGETRCLACRHIVNNDHIVTIIKDGKARGKRVCLDCGLRYLASAKVTTQPDANPQCPGQTSLAV